MINKLKLGILEVSGFDKDGDVGFCVDEDFYTAYIDNVQAKELIKFLQSELRNFETAKNTTKDPNQIDLIDSIREVQGGVIE